MQQTLFLTPGAIPHLLNDWWGWNEYSYLVWPNRHDLDWKFSISEQQHAGDMFPAGLAGSVTSLGVGFIAGPYSSRCDELHAQGCFWHDLTQCTSKYISRK